MHQEGQTRILELVPNKGVLPIEFGMDRHQVLAVVGVEPHWSTTDHLGDSKLQEHYDDFIGVHYDSSDKVYSVVVAPGRIVVHFKGVELFGPNAVENPLKVFCLFDAKPFEDVGFVVFDNIGIAVTGYHGVEGDEPTITVFRSGTWSSEGCKPFSLDT